MANATLPSSSALRGLCPAPFYDMSNFGTGGCKFRTLRRLYNCLTLLDAAGRFCAPISQIQAGLNCCLPCPATDYFYPPEFRTWYRAAEALNLAGLVCLAFLLISFIFLPAEKTRRHYLSYCLIIAAMFLAVCSAISVQWFVTHA